MTKNLLRSIVCVWLPPSKSSFAATAHVLPLPRLPECPQHCAGQILPVAKPAIARLLLRAGAACVSVPRQAGSERGAHGKGKHVSYNTSCSWRVHQCVPRPLSLVPARDSSRVIERYGKIKGSPPPDICARCTSFLETTGYNRYPWPSFKLTGAFSRCRLARVLCVIFFQPSWVATATSVGCANGRTGEKLTKSSKDYSIIPIDLASRAPLYEPYVSIWHQDSTLNSKKKTSN